MVRLWLGDSIPSEIAGLELAPRFAAAQAEREKREDTRGYAFLTPADFESYNLPASNTSPAYSSFVSLCGRRVFSRGWVLQEIALAEYITFHCGNFSLEGKDFYMAFQCCSDLGYITVSDELIAQFLRIIALRVAAQDGKVDLFYLLELAKYFETQDPRDKVYALLGLAQDAKALGIRPDYGVSWIDVYKSTVMRMIETYGVLDVLGAPKTGRIDHEASNKLLEIETRPLPSWVPDWRYSRVEIENLGGVRSHNQRYYAAGSSKARVILHEQDKNLLGVSGYGVDRVAECSIAEPSDGGSSLEGLETGEGDLSFMLYYIYRVNVSNFNFIYQGLDRRRTARASTTESYTVGTESKEDAYWQTLAAGYKFESDEELAEAKTLYYKWNSHFLHLGRFWSWVPHTATNVVLLAAAAGTMIKLLLKEVLYQFSWFRRPSTEEQKDATFRKFMAGTVFRKLVRTERGYFCMAPITADIGDEIVLFEGGRLPFMLRRSEKSQNWELLGDCYVHGMMSGELFEQEKCETIWIE